MNNEREEEDRDKHGSNKENSPRNTESSTVPDYVNTGTGGSSEAVNATMVSEKRSPPLSTLPVIQKGPILDGLSPTSSVFNVPESDIKIYKSSTADSVNTGKDSSSESADTTAATKGSSSSSGSSMTKKSPIFDRLSPTSSGFYDPKSDIRKSISSSAGSDVWPSPGVAKYNSLITMGISRRKKYFPEDSSVYPEGSPVDLVGTDASSPPHSPQSHTPILPKFYPYAYSKIDNESTAGMRYVMRSGTRSDIHVIDESEEKVDERDIPTEEREITTHGSLDDVKQQDSIKERLEKTLVSHSDILSPNIHFMTIASLEGFNQDDSNEIKTPVMGVEREDANRRILGEAFRQIIQALEPRKQPQDHAATHESDTTDNSFENSAVDNYLNAKIGNDFCDSKTSHSGHPVYSSNTEKETIDCLPTALATPTIEFSSVCLNEVRSKKSVYFADTVGLELTDIHPVSNSQSPPYIPQSVLDKLKAGFEKKPKEFSQKLLSPCFDQPGADFNFIKKVLNQKVCLENVLVSDMTINGFVRVAKIATFQSVLVRYSTNDWVSYDEVEATPMSENPDGVTQRFSFILEGPSNMEPASYLELVVLMIASSTEYADYNDGNNYKLQCVLKIPSLLAS